MGTLVRGRSLSRLGANIETKCASALSQWEDLSEPAEIEEAVKAFLPRDEPQKSATVETLAKARELSAPSLHAP